MYQGDAEAVSGLQRYALSEHLPNRAASTSLKQFLTLLGTGSKSCKLRCWWSKQILSGPMTLAGLWRPCNCWNSPSKQLNKS